MIEKLNPQAEAVIESAWMDFRAGGADFNAFRLAMITCAMRGEPVERRIAEAAMKMRDALAMIRDSEPAESSARRIADVAIAEVNRSPAQRRAAD